MKRQWYYRGSLKSCNYSCNYCPFSKKKGSTQEQQQDKTALYRFIDRINELPTVEGAVQIVPYGEALIHPYYWEGLARLSQNPRIDAVGAQSNFSFPVHEMLSIYRKHGGDTSKLRLWGTFHPQMTTVEQFAAQCHLLSEQNIAYCAGAVGVPSELNAIRQLRKTLPSSVYLWINKMDGMKRAYTPSEINDFLKIDAYFERELSHHRADISACADNRFVESDGTIHPCNLSRQNLGNFYDTSAELPERICTRKECSCYLAYCNRMEPEMICFMPYPAFRIPVYPKAVFLDVDGTLIPEGKTKIPERYIKWLQHLADYNDIYLATSLPYETARKRTHAVWSLLCGGVFANGARRIIKKYTLDEIEPLQTDWLAQARKKGKALGFHLHTYQKGGIIYKVTFVCHKGKLPQNHAKEYLKEITHTLGIPQTCETLAEQNCIQITAGGTSKLSGILDICEKMDYKKQEVAAVGNSENDLPMIKYFPNSVYITAATQSKN